MEQLVGGLMTVAIFFAIVYAIARAATRTVLQPIHAKLDRLLALQEQARTPDSADAVHR